MFGQYTNPTEDVLSVKRLEKDLFGIGYPKKIKNVIEVTNGVHAQGIKCQYINNLPAIVRMLESLFNAIILTMLQLENP